MLLLLFEIGDKCFALDAAVVVRVIPRIACEKTGEAEDFIAGVINVQGKPVPVIDLCLYHHSIPCKSRLSTRIIIVNYIRENYENVHVGLVAERVTETVRVDDSCIYENNIKINYSISQQAESNMMVQWYDLDQLLTEELLDEIIQE